MKCPACQAPGSYINLNKIECMNSSCSNFHDPKIPDPIEACNRIMSSFLEQVSQQERVTTEDAQVAVEISKHLQSTTIIKLGDAKSGFHPSPKAYQKMIDMIKTRMKEPWKQRVIVWDDLVDKCIIDKDCEVKEDTIP